MGTYANGVYEKGYSGGPSLEYVKHWYDTSPDADPDISSKNYEDAEHVFCRKASDVLRSVLTEDSLKSLSENGVDIKDVVFSISATLIDKEGNSYENIHLEYSYNPNAEFTNLYGTSFHHDGTLLFIEDGIRKLFQDMFDFTPSFPGKWEYAKNPDGKKIKVEYGDFIILNLYGSGPKGKEWMGQETVINVPMRFSVVENMEGKSL